MKKKQIKDEAVEKLRSELISLFDIATNSFFCLRNKVHSAAYSSENAYEIQTRWQDFKICLKQTKTKIREFRKLLETKTP